VHQAIGELQSSAPLQTRVGIATGLVVFGELIGSGESQERAGSCLASTDGHGQGLSNTPVARFVCRTGARQVLLVTAKDWLFPAKRPPVPQRRNCRRHSGDSSSPRFFEAPRSFAGELRQRPLDRIAYTPR
jgi:hypothetical protein